MLLILQLNCGFELVTRGFEHVTGTFELTTRELELVTCISQLAIANFMKDALFLKAQVIFSGSKLNYFSQILSARSLNAVLQAPQF